MRAKPAKTKAQRRRAEEVVRFIKLKSWFIPADRESYRVLRRLNLAEVRYSEDFIETLVGLLRKKKITATARPFAEVEREFFEKFEAAWLSKPNRKLTRTSKCIKLEARDVTARLIQQVLPDAESCLQRFCRRWGLASSSSLHESPTRVRLEFSMTFDKERLPVIEFIEGA